MPVLGPEGKIDRKVVAFARKHGIIVIKLEAGRAGTTGLPDRMFLYHGHVMFREMKAPGKKLTALQEHRLKQLREAGFNVGVIYNADKGIEEVIEFIFTADAEEGK